jgi:polyphosphate:AMP phosphotransferase
MSHSKLKSLGEKIAFLQRRCRELRIPVLVVFEGLSAAGKGTLINRLIQPMDPRGFKVSCIRDPNGEERLRPFLWRFWNRTPSADRMAIFDRSWYRTILEQEVSGELGMEGLAKAYIDIRSFERQLFDSGTLIVKFHLQVSKDEQSRRLAAIQENPSTAWRVTKEVLERHKRYDIYFPAIERMLTVTNQPEAPWTVIDADDLDAATESTMESLALRLESFITLVEMGKLKVPAPKSNEMPYFANAPKISAAKMENSLDNDAYLELLEERQSRIHELQSEAYRRRIPVVIVYEGQDAAGKGGNIRRLTQRMDPRGYEVIPVAAPNDLELAHHYLWRFWKEFPKAGHVTIFDRSWYGRVLVERIEGFCKKGDWKRAYGEINEMEENFYHFGCVLIKFWIQIDKKEQLRRFRSREESTRKRWKLNEEDWRNREKWELYEEAAQEMIDRTHTSYAPWTIIEGNCKRLARIQALETVIEAISERLEKAPEK